MKIATVIGARPQFIKASVVSRALASTPAMSEVLIHTGQHYDNNMSAVFFEELEIPQPKYNLNIGSGPHGQQTGRQLAALEEVLIKERPDLALVYGDTNSTLAGALAAAKLQIPIAHVEAGLRSFNRSMPEEINRILTDHCSSLLFASTATAVRNLRREGIDSKKVHAVGDVMYDVALYYSEKAKLTSGILADLKIKPGQFILATIHRAANTDDLNRLRLIIEALTACSETLPVVLPLHPRTKGILKEAGITFGLGQRRILTIAPVGYLAMVTLEKNAAVIVTDSGGVQKEAFFYRVPCVTLRDETEWVELVKTGWNRLCPLDSVSKVVRTIIDSIGSSGSSIFPYGRGDAAMRILKILSAL